MAAHTSMFRQPSDLSRPATKAGESVLERDPLDPGGMPPSGAPRLQSSVRPDTRASKSQLSPTGAGRRLTLPLTPVTTIDVQGDVRTMPG
jgi:hypothetical protein